MLVDAQPSTAGAQISPGDHPRRAIEQGRRGRWPAELLVTIGGYHQRIVFKTLKIERQCTHNILLTESLALVQSIRLQLICCSELIMLASLESEGTTMFQSVD